MSNKVTMDFKVFEKYAEQFDRLGGDVQAAATQVLQNAHDMITPEVQRVMMKHNKTHKTERAILRNSRVEWSGNLGSIGIGFDLANGGFASIYLMYGTPRHAPGHPGTNADQELYDAIYGSRTRSQMKQMTEKVMQRAIQKRLGG